MRTGTIRGLGCAALLVLSATWPGCGLKAQDVGSQAGQLWKDATSAYGQGNYAQAATSLEAIIKASGASTTWSNHQVVPPATAKQQWLEPVFFLLGAAYFDAKDWPHAIDVLNRYRQLFPSSPRLPQAIFSQGQADLWGGHPEEAIPLLTLLLPLPEYHGRAFLFLVEANLHAGKPEDAIALLEKEKTQPNLSTAYICKLNLRLLPLYLTAENEKKAWGAVQQLDENITDVTDVPLFNSMAERLGDLFLSKNDMATALACYRRVRDNAEIISVEKQQIDRLQHTRTDNLAKIQANPLRSSAVQRENQDIDVEIAKDQDMVTKYQALAPVLPPVFLRIARAYSRGGMLWESGVAYRELMRRYPQAPEVEAALYGSIIVFDQVKAYERAQSLCQDYLTQFPKGRYADSVGFLRGALAYDEQDYDKATTYFEESLANQPNNPRRQETEMILGDIQLQTGKFDNAIAAYQKYEKEFPHGALLEKAEYRAALALLFSGKADDAVTAIQAYLQKYPHGTYAADAEYRLDVVKFANKQYDQVLADGAAWQKKYAQAAPLAEVLSLMGDCYEMEDKHDEAVQAYIRSYKAAQTAEVLNYSLTAATKILQKQGKWADIAAMYHEFIRNNPDNPTVVTAVFWIGRADIKLGQVEEGKQFMADTAKKYLNDPSREAVDEIITQLAQLYAHRRLAPAPASAAPAPAGPAVSGSGPVEVAAGAPAVAAAMPAPPPSDPARELSDILTVPDLATKPTARARILYATAELARLQRKLDVEAQILQQIGGDFKPENLSPLLLGKVGDCLVLAGKMEQAAPFYNQLMDEYDKSPLVDYAYNGLAEIAFAEKDYKKADRYYSKALDKALAASKLKDITLGEARTLLALNRPSEAKPLFEQVASTRAWRGEATALSVFSLGEIQMEEGNLAAANAFYQRVFVAYQKYPSIQAKAYLKSAEAFEKMGKIVEARNTYAEMLRNPNLATFPEASDARQRLERLTQ